MWRPQPSKILQHRFRYLSPLVNTKVQVVSGDCLGCRLPKKNLSVNKKVRSQYFSNLRGSSYSRMNSFSGQALIDVHHSVTEVAKYPRNLHHCNSWPSDPVLDWPMNVSQITPDGTFTPYALLAAPDLSETYGSEHVWSGDRLACPSATSASNDTDIIDQLLSSNTTTNLSQPYAPYYVSVCAGIMPPAVEESPSSYPIRRHHSVRKPSGGSAGKHVGASRTQSTAASSRHTPYPLSHETAKWGSLTVICQWTSSANPCGETVVGTKKALGQHLQAKHAIRLKPDMTICLWGECRKSMRRESIARHILAIHIQDKVPCMGCGSYFARLDSLQRHQRTCLAKVREENASEACEV